MKKYKNKKQYRYKGYDYSQDGFYFVTICAKNREMFFGDVVDSKMILSETGEIAEKCWREIPVHFPFVKLDEFVVMPNHIHGIIQINKESQNVGTQNVGTQNVGTQNVGTQNVGTQNVGTQNFAFLREYKNKFGPQSKNLSSIIRGFKIGVTKRANNNNLEFAWQSRFHDRIIRNEDELNRIRQYIINNSLKWELDRNNLENLYM